MGVELNAGSIVLNKPKNGVNYSELSVPLESPIIQVHTGNFAHGAEITLSGVFTAKNTSQVLYFTGDASQNGNVPTEFVPINGSPLNIENPNCYKYTTEQSFSGSGSSIRFRKTSEDIIEGPHNTKILLPQREKELYFTYTSYVVMNDWSSQQGGQLKMGRMSTVTNTHSSDPVFGHTDLRNGTRSAISYFSTLPTYTPMVYASSGLPAYVEDTINKWIRFEEWAKLPDYPSKSQATVGFLAQAFITETGDKLMLGNTTEDLKLHIEEPVKNWEYAWKEFAFDKAILPFYVRSWMDCTIYLDSIYLNDSPERVELGDRPLLVECTKKIVQKQIMREVDNLTFVVSTGNFTDSDDIYAFVVNSDGQYSEGHLIRSKV